MQEVLSATSTVGPLLVGSVLVLTGLVKVLDLQQFVRHLSRLRLFPARSAVPAAMLFVTLELSWGVALVVGLWLSWLLPLTSALFIAFAGITWWSVRTGRVEDCGCYGGLVDLSPRASIALDGVYVTLLLLAWVSPQPLPQAAPWKLDAVVAAAVLGVLLTVASHRRTATTGSPLLRMAPVRVGRRWQVKWLQGPLAEETVRGSKIVVFLSPACTLCKRWVQVLNLAHGLEGLPEVIGVVSVRPERLEVFRARAGARFSMVAIKPWSLKRLTRGELPTAVLLCDGEVRDLWVRSLPAELGQQIRQRFIAARGAVPTPAAEP